MKKYLYPLWVFVGGNLIGLILFLFLGAISSAASDLETATAGIASTFWLWSWVVANVKFIVWFGVVMATLYATAKAFLSVR